MAQKAHSLSHTKWMCKYHIVFTPKYRRKVIYNQYRSSLGEIFHRLCSYKGVEIIEGHLMPDHVHMLVSIPPRISVASFMGYLKGKSALMMFDKDVAATKAAVEEGIIQGGGSAYIHASKEVAKLAAELEGDEKTGAKIILKALEAPLFHIAANAGLEGSVIINKVRESEVGVGFDALNEEYVNMVEAGILDPAKVTRSALQNATSVASTFLTTESAVASIKEDTPAMPAGAGMGGMM